MGPRPRPVITMHYNAFLPASLFGTHQSERLFPQIIAVAPKPQVAGHTGMRRAQIFAPWASERPGRHPWANFLAGSAMVRQILRGNRGWTRWDAKIDDSGPCTASSRGGPTQ